MENIMRRNWSHMLQVMMHMLQHSKLQQQQQQWQQQQWQLLHHFLAAATTRSTASCSRRTQGEFRYHDLCRRTWKSTAALSH